MILLDWFKIKKMFPEMQTKKNVSQEHIVLEINNEQVYLPVSSLTEREKIILNSFKMYKNNKTRNANNWVQFLSGKNDKPKTKSRFRFIYFVIKNLNIEEREKWLHQILSFFNPQVQYFWQTINILVIIDEDIHYSKNDLVGVLTTIDSDFSTITNLLIGLIWNKKDNIREVFKEEQDILNKVGWKQQYTTIPECALEFYIKYKAEDSIILSTYSTKLKANPDLESLVKSLYDVGSNVTQAAKRMFIHRNTLEYRIDKFYQQYSFNLRKIDDLVFCYLLFV